MVWIGYGYIEDEGMVWIGYGYIEDEGMVWIGYGYIEDVRVWYGLGMDTLRM